MSKKTLLFLTGVISLSILFGVGEGIAQSYTLTINEPGGGSGTVTSSPKGITCPSDCSEAYVAGKRVTLRAKPSSDSYFASWSGGGCSGTKSCSVIMNSDVTVTANFEKKVPKLSVSTDQLDFGEVEVGNKAQQNLILSNIGTANLNAAITVTGDFFSIKGKSNVTIRPGKSYKLQVLFQPQPDYPEIDIEGVDLGSDSPFLVEGSQPSSCEGALIILSGEDGKLIVLRGKPVVDPEIYTYNIDPDFFFSFHDSDEDREEKNTQTIKGMVIMDYAGDQWTHGKKESFYTGYGQVQFDVDQSITETKTSSITTTKGSGLIDVQIAARITKTSMIIDVVRIEGKIPVEICKIDNYGSECLSGEGVDFPYRYSYDNNGGDNLNCPLCDGAEAIVGGECPDIDPNYKICNKFVLRILYIP